MKLEFTTCLAQQGLHRLFLVVLLSFSVVLVTGCQGCRDDKQKTAEEKKREEEEKKEREKPSFETESAVVYPGQYSNVTRKNRTKRGHWVTADFRITANKFDTQGELSATSFSTNSPVPVEQTDYVAVSTRPFSIPKGEPKNLETNVYLPRRDVGSSANINFAMIRNTGGLAQFSEIHGVTLMKSFQYHMVVLTNRPDSYGYLNMIDSVALPQSETGVVVPPFYNVVRTRPLDEPISLPRHALNWTTISYLIWDDFTVDQLDADQQQALVDWLHFGGQLILSGPDCLDKLNSSFLAEYLPARFSASRNLSAQDFVAINEHWAVKVKNQDLRRVISVTEKSPVIGIDFDVHPRAKFVTNTGKLAVERQIGRGRIVATAFSLDDKPIIRWPSYRSFFNGALLRRPGRRFGTTPEGTLSFIWEGDTTSAFDPLIGSTLRYLSRDLVNVKLDPTWSKGTPISPAMTPELITGVEGFGGNPNYIGYSTSQFDERYRTRDGQKAENRNLDDHWHYGGFQHDEQSGIAGWNDNSGISRAARDTLKQAAGISPPSSSFVLKMLAIYLLVLVPVNWLVFRLIGRVEWAWIAAPFIAVGGAFMVARMASLDIGFVRSNSQVGCFEAYADYPRAHVSQYSALYTSLSTGYDIDLDNPSAQSLPMGDPSKKWKEKTLSPVTIRKTISSRLEGFQVQSNSTGMLHTEMMFDMLGVFSLNQQDEDFRVENSTSVSISEAAVLRRTPSGELQSAWIGELESGSVSNVLEFKPIAGMTEPWNDSNVLTSRHTAEKYLEKLSTIAETAITDSVASVQFPIAEIEEQLPELDWEGFLKIVSRRLPPMSRDELLDTEISADLFQKVVLEMEQVENVNVSGMFREVAEHLALAPGEVRMVAITDQPTGNNSFSPASTQTQQQTLVLVHLQRPPLANATGDVNAIEDFTGRSNLDWLEEEAALDELTDSLDE